MAVCKNCGATLCADEISVFLKLVSREAKTYLCKQCLSDTFHCVIALIDRKIEQFKRNGCLLFTLGVQKNK